MTFEEKDEKLWKLARELAAHLPDAYSDVASAHTFLTEAYALGVKMTLQETGEKQKEVSSFFRQFRV